MSVKSLSKYPLSTGSTKGLYVATNGKVWVSNNGYSSVEHHTLQKENPATTVVYCFSYRSKYEASILFDGGLMKQYIQDQRWNIMFEAMRLGDKLTNMRNLKIYIECCQDKYRAAVSEVGPKVVA